MNFWIVIFCTILSISAHELGHAFAMLRHDVKIKSICLLGFGPKLFEFRLTRWFGDVPIEIRLIPIGASVKPMDGPRESNPFRNLSFMARSEIAGAGIINNTALACLFLLLGTVCNGLEHGFLPRQIVLVLTCLVFAITCLKWQRWLSPLIPLVGIITISTILFSIFKGTSTPAETIGGPIETVHFIRKESVQFHGLFDVFGFSGILSLSIGLVNCFPFLPLDGGHIMDAWIKKMIGAKRYERSEILITTLLIAPGLLFILSVLGHDIYKFIASFF